MATRTWSEEGIQGRTGCEPLCGTPSKTPQPTAPFGSEEVDLLQKGVRRVEAGSAQRIATGKREGSAALKGTSFWRLIPQLTGTSSKVVSVISEEGVIRYQSKPIEGLLGYAADLLIGQRLDEVLCSSCREAAREAVGRMAQEEEKFDCWRMAFRTASDESLWLEGMASNFLRDPRLGGILVYWHEFAGAS